MFQQVIESISHLPVPEIKLSKPTALVLLQSFNAYAAGRPRWPDAYWERAQLLRATHEVYSQVLELQKVFVQPNENFEKLYAHFADALWVGMVPALQPHTDAYAADWIQICRAAPKAVKLTTLPMFQAYALEQVRRWSSSSSIHTLLTIKGQDATCAGYHLAVGEPGWAMLSRQVAQYGAVNEAALPSIAMGTLPFTRALMHEAALVLNKELENNPWP